MEWKEIEKVRENGSEERSSHEASPRWSSLPLELMTEIFRRLPTKSVGRFRCVSKPFYSLLSDPKFAKNHLHLILRNDTVEHLRLILSLDNLFTVDFDSVGEGIKDLTAVELDYPLKEDFDLLPKWKARTVRIWDGTEVSYIRDSRFCKRSWVAIVGSSNGLVCTYYYNDDIVFLYNPTTRESKRIPDLPESQRSRSVNAEVQKMETYGFGYDAVTDDYKLVKFVGIDIVNNLVNANVYSLKTNSWRLIPDLRYNQIHPRSGVHLNGAIHWIAKLEKSNERVIAVFDLNTEEFREMSLPDEAKDCPHKFKKLAVRVLKGCLCVVYGCYETHDVMWVMNEYGVESSWCKIQLNHSYSSMKPLCSIKNDKEVIVVLDKRLVLYNFESNTWRNLVINGVYLGKEFEADTYLESLISPNSYHNGVET